jgi:hypothetical protein
MNILVMRGSFSWDAMTSSHTGLVCFCHAQPGDITKDGVVKDGLVKKLTTLLDSRKQKEEVVIIVPFSLLDIRIETLDCEDARELFGILKANFKEAVFAPFDSREKDAVLTVRGGKTSLGKFFNV